MGITASQLADLYPVAVCLLAVTQQCSCGTQHESYDGVVVEYAPTTKGTSRQRFFKRMPKDHRLPLQHLPRRVLNVTMHLDACGACWHTTPDDAQLSFMDVLYPPRVRVPRPEKKNYLTLDEL